MKKTVMTALLVAGVGGIAGQAFAQAVHPPYVPNYVHNVANKVGVLNVSLANTFQLYWNGASDFSKSTTFGVMTNINGSKTAFHWSDHSYRHLENCAGTVAYNTGTGKIDNLRLINALNAGLSYTTTQNGRKLYGLFNYPDTLLNPYYGGAFTKGAKIVLAHYENEQQAPPYPPDMDVYWNGFVSGAPTFPDIWLSTWYNAPWAFELQNITSGGNLLLDGDMIPLEWANKQLNSWGKPYTYIDPTTATETVTWDYPIAPDPADDPATGTPKIAKPGTQVFVIDPANKNANLQCFDVTPFFTFEEAVCQYCWDTMDRVTKGTISKGTLCVGVGCNDFPCQNSPPGFTCSASGNGTTKFFLTVKFNNINPQFTVPVNGSGNTLLAPYYVGDTINTFGYVGGPQLGNALWVQNAYASATTGLTWGWKLDVGDEAGSVNSLNIEVSGIVTYVWSYKAVDIGGGLKSKEVMGTMSMSAQGHGWTPMCGVMNGPVTITDVGRLDKSFNVPATKVPATTCVNGNFP